MIHTYDTNWIPHEDAMLSNVKYYNWEKDEIYAVFWKDLRSKNKDNHIELIREPEVPIYFKKEEFRHGPNKYMAKLDELERVAVRPSQITKTIANRMGPAGYRIYQNAIRSHDWRAMKEIYKWPYSFGADYPPEMFYRIWWKENCSTELAPYVKTSFSDIEVDNLNAASWSIDEMIDRAENPVNAISIYYQHENEMHVYLLIPNGVWGGDLGPKQLADYMDLMKHWDGFLKEIHDVFDKTYGVIDYQFHWYKPEDEIKMMVDYFFLINQRKPDFVGFWNMSFDMPYMMSRCERLGANPKDVICDPGIPYQELRFKKDTRNFDFKESGDFLYSSTVPQYICLMRNYAKHRKQVLYQSYSLDSISDFELGDSKLKYGEDGTTIRDLWYRNFRKFILYNIKDTLLTKQIDLVTGDCEYTWIVSNDNLTNYDQIFSPSLSLRCIVYDEFLRQALGEY